MKAKRKIKDMVCNNHSKAKVIFRANGSYKLGLGHVMRCIAFAQGFRNRSIDSLFVVKDGHPKLIELIQNNKFAVITIPRSSTLKEDAEQILKLMKLFAAGVLVVDMNNFQTMACVNEYKNYLAFLNQGCSAMLVIGGLEEAVLLSDIALRSSIVIIPYCGAQTGVIKKNGITYLGAPDYFIFRNCFIKAVKNYRLPVKNAKNVLVTMGGSDPHGLTIKIVASLAKITDMPLHIKVVVGPAFINSAAIRLKSLVKKHRGVVELICDSDGNMAKMMLWADIVITSTGLTRYEAALLGVPTIVISYDDNQKQIMDDFEHCGCALYIGQAKNIESIDIQRTVIQLLADTKLRRQMSAKGRKLVDGKGIARIISHIPKEALQ